MSARPLKIFPKMNRDRCIELIRTGSAKFCVSDVETSFPDASTTHWRSGLITCSKGRFRLSVPAVAGANVSPLAGTFVRSSDFGTAVGVMDSSLAFRIPALQPCMTHDNVILHFNFDRLDFSDESSSQAPVDRVAVHGVLENYKLIAPEERTTTIKRSAVFGETEGWSLDTTKGNLVDNWSFGLIRREKDLEFILRKSGGKPSAFDEEQRLIAAFFKSVAFIHGQHAWPIWMRHERDGKYVCDWIRPPTRPIRSPHRPFNERIWFNAKVGKIRWNFNEALLCAFNFFLSESDLAEEITELVHQLRDATSGDGVKKVNNIVLCALLESAVNAIFESRARSQATVIEQEFDRMRGSLIETIREHKSTCVGENAAAAQQARERLINKLSNTPYWYSREKFQAVAEGLGLKWCDDWENLFNFWNKWRHPVVHRGSRSTDENDFTTFKIQSRFAGAIYLLVLRAMGYSGVVIKSVFEDAFTNI